MKKLKNQLEEAKSKIPLLQEYFLQGSCTYIEQVAKYNLSRKIGLTDYQLSNELMSSFQSYVTENVGHVINFSSYASYVEYGTGIKGKAFPHPENTGYTSKAFWSYFDKKNGKLRFTKGLPAYRYMYDAINTYFTTGMEQIFEEAFKNVIGGM